MSDCGKLTCWGLLLVTSVMLTTSFLGAELGLPTLVAALLIVMGIAWKKNEFPKKVFHAVTWGVIPLVAGLFVVVQAVNQAGALHFVQQTLIQISQCRELTGKICASFGIGLFSNIANNLPVGLISGMAVRHSGVSEVTRNAVLIGVDLGPNLSVTGSLATLLWLMAIRREGEKVRGLDFLKVGLIAMPLALLFSTLLL